MTEKELIAQGEELVTITSFPGWDIVLHLLSDTAEASRDKLLAIKGGGDPHLVVAAHARYRAQVEMLDSLKYSVQVRIDAYNRNA